MRSKASLALTLLTLFAACGDSHGPLAADGGDRAADDRSENNEHTQPHIRADGGNSPAHDAGLQTDANQSQPEAVAYATDIVVENVGAEPILLNPNCGAVWVSVSRGDEKLDVTRYCKTPCDTPGVAGCPAICLTTQKLVVPGERKTFTWDGIYLERGPRSCDEALAPEKATELTATVCWDATLPWSAEPECSSTTFKYGEEREVVVRAQREIAKPRTTTLVLTNTLDHPIEILAEQCGYQGVFSIDKDKTSMLWINCACVCDAATRNGSCPNVSCGACYEDVPKTLQPGESFEFIWDQNLWHAALSFCMLRYVLAPDDELQMRACWRESAGADQECTAATVRGTDTRVELKAGASKP